MLDLLSEDVRRNPFPVYARLRIASPLVHDPRTGLYAVFDYESVRRVLTDHEVFSSRYGPDWLIFTDPPRHRHLRALISQAFTPRSIAALEPRIAALSTELLTAATGRDSFDLVADYADPLPLRVIGDMLGIPATDQPVFLRWNDVLLRMSQTVAGGPGVEAAMSAYIAATAEMKAYVLEQLDRRRTQPTDDLLTRLHDATVDGQRLTLDEIVGFFQLLLLAGSETTSNLLANAALVFHQHPDQLALLRRNADLLPGAIEELLRYRSPVQWLYRITRQEVTLHGQTLKPGRLVLAMIGSANHDPAAFPSDPDRFDITRTPNPHLGFGHGHHFCLGASLARLEARIALPDLLLKSPTLELTAPTSWAPRPGLNILGPATLPARLRP